MTYNLEVLQFNRLLLVVSRTVSDGLSLINIDGKIVEPATELIRKISDAIGGGFKPYQIRRIAEAEADAEAIKAKAQIKITTLQQRAVIRFIMEESKKQDNIESITEKAILQLNASSTPQDIEDDWITNFFDKCRIVSDEDMQLLWSKVLAGESNSPGTFSKRTVNSLGSLDKKDAQLFTALCGFIWLIEGRLVPFIYHLPLSNNLPSDRTIYGNNKIDFEALAHLCSIGLISFEPVGYYQNELNQQTDLSYYKTTVRVEFANPKNNELSCGNVLLTNVGKELAKVCASKPVDGFADFIIKIFSQEGLVVSSPYPRQDI